MVVFVSAFRHFTQPRLQQSIPFFACSANLWKLLTPQAACYYHLSVVGILAGTSDYASLKMLYLAFPQTTFNLMSPGVIWVAVSVLQTSTA